MPEVLVLQHVGCEPLGTVAAGLDRAGVSARCHLSNDDNPVPKQIGDMSGLVVLGGPMAVYEQDKYPYLADEIDLIRRFYDSGRPILGICLGAQLLAAALGAEVHPGVDQEIGWYPIRLAESAPTDPLWKGLPETFMGFHWHGDIFELPVGAVSLARSEQTPCQAFRPRDGVYGLQFHMEVDEAIIADWVETYSGDAGQASHIAERVTSGVDAYLPALRRTALTVFSRWAAILST